MGEFLHLRPVPNSFDDGQCMLCLALFDIANPHRLELTGPETNMWEFFIYWSSSSRTETETQQWRVSFFSVHLADQLKVTQCAHLFQEAICLTTQLTSSAANARTAVHFRQQRWRQYNWNKLSYWSASSPQTTDQDYDHMEPFWDHEKLHFKNIFGNERWVVRGQNYIILKWKTAKM